MIQSPGSARRHGPDAALAPRAPGSRLRELVPMQELVFTAWTRAAETLHRRSRALVAFLDVRMETLITAWIAVTVALGLLKVVLSPVSPPGFGEFTVMLLPYLLIAFAPIAGYRVAAGSFPRGLLSAQPAVRLCRYGAWRRLDPLAARQNAAFGPAGFMASLLVGILLNVPLRSLEFIMAVPAIAPAAPGWAQTLMIAMTIDVVVMNFFYMVCFVMALRSVPLFPRMLLFVWIADIALQFGIASTVGTVPGLPLPVADALQQLLHGNIQKVLVSAFVWLPYLIVSERVNVTFRQRMRA
jgi:hypothetical protein